MSKTLDDYRDEIKDDIKEYLDQENLWPKATQGTDEYDGEREAAYQRLWIADSVTGNASGSYTFNAWQAEENISHLLWDEDFWNVLRSNLALEPSADIFKEGPEYLDVSIRCALLSECLDAVLDEKYESED